MTEFSSLGELWPLLCIGLSTCFFKI